MFWGDKTDWRPTWLELRGALYKFWNCIPADCPTQLTFVGEKAECTDGAGTGWMGWDATCPTLSTQLGSVRAGVGNSWTLKVVSNFSVSFAIGSSGFYGLWSWFGMPLVWEGEPEWSRLVIQAPAHRLPGGIRFKSEESTECGDSAGCLKLVQAMTCPTVSSKTRNCG